MRASQFWHNNEISCDNERAAAAAVEEEKINKRTKFGQLTIESWMAGQRVDDGDGTNTTIE